MIMRAYIWRVSFQVKMMAITSLILARASFRFREDERSYLTIPAAVYGKHMRDGRAEAFTDLFCPSYSFLFIFPLFSRGRLRE